MCQGDTEAHESITTHTQDAKAAADNILRIQDQRSLTAIMARSTALCQLLSSVHFDLNKNQQTTKGVQAQDH